MSPLFLGPRLIFVSTYEDSQWYRKDDEVCGDRLIQQVDSTLLVGA